MRYHCKSVLLTNRYMLVMDHVGQFGVVAIMNADTKVLSTIPLYSDIHVLHPFKKDLKLPASGETSEEKLEGGVVQISEPQLLYVNLISMSESTAPSQFNNKVFS